MELYFNYLHRELFYSKELNKISLINDRQRVYEDYSVILDLDMQDKTAETLKNLFRQAVKVLYQDYRNLEVINYSHVGADFNINCFSMRFDDEQYNVKCYTQPNFSGQKYYNYPSLVLDEEKYLIDIRTIVSGLIKKTDLCSYIRKLIIKHKGISWEILSPRPGKDFLINSESITLSFYGSERVFKIDNAEFFFPLDIFPEQYPAVKNINACHIPFAIITKGFSSSPALTFEMGFTPKLICGSDDKTYYWTLSGYFNYLSSLEETGNIEKFLNGTFLAATPEFTINSVVDDFKKIFRLAFSLMPMFVAEKNQKGEISIKHISHESLCPDKLDELTYYFITEDEEKLKSFGISYAVMSARHGFLSSIPVARAVKNYFIRPAVYFHSNKITHFSDDDNYYKWVVRYDLTKEEGNAIITVSYSSDMFLKNPNIVSFELSFYDKFMVAYYDCRYVEGKILLTLNRWRMAFAGSGDNEISELTETVKSRILSFEDARGLNLELKKLAENITRLYKLISEKYPGNNAYKIQHRSRMHGKPVIQPVKAGTLTSSVEKKEEPPVEEPVEPDVTEQEALEFFLSQTTENNKLSISEALSDEISIIFMPWLSLMQRAKQYGVSVRDYIKKYKPQIPQLPHLAIMGEAGTGKTTMAKKLAVDCMGANFLSILGGELKGAYVGWDKAVMAKRINDVQKDTPNDTPAVIFLDEAYTIFESNQNNTSWSGEIVEMLLKLCEEGEYDIDVSEFGEKELDKMGMSFYVNSISGYEDTSLYKTLLCGMGRYKVYPLKIRKRKNTVLWIGGYEERLRKSFQANEGLSRRFKDKLVIPSPKMTELWKLFSDNALKNNIILSADDEKKIKSFIKWASSKTRSSIFGNYSGVRTLLERFLRENHLRMNVTEACERAAAWYKNDITKQYKSELARDLGKMPFEVVTDIDLTMDDYAGNHGLKEKINDIIEMMLENEEYEKKHISLPKGALLMGPPGTGKTMLVKCMSGELQKRLNELTDGRNQRDVAFIPTSAAEILATRNPVNAISVLFSEAAGYDAAVIFIDEIDTIGKNRAKVNNTGPLTQLMKELDGFSSTGCIFVIAATNDPDILDPALVREGRFDMRIEVGIPDKATSEELFRLYLKKYGFDYDRLDEDEEKSEEYKDRLINYLGGRVPAFIKAMLNQAVMLYHKTEKGLELNDETKHPLEYAHRRKADGKYLRTKDYDGTVSDFNIFLRDLKEVIDTKDLGARVYIDDDEKFTVEQGSNGSRSSVAIHEIGHALCGLVLGWKTVEKITILGRGDTMGYVEPKRNEKPLVTKADYLDRIKILMGGRTAEEIIYGSNNISPGAMDDIRKASDLARMLVGEFGFSDEIGFMALGRRTGRYLESGFELTASPEYLNKMDNEINRILKECMAETRNILSERKELLIKMAGKLFESKELSGDELEELYNISMNMG